MRVLVFLPCLTLGGAERQGLLAARFLRERGHEVELWGFPPPGGQATLVPELESSGLSYAQLSAWPRLRWSYARFGPLWSAARRRQWTRPLDQLIESLPAGQFDAVIPFTFWPSLTACLARERLGARLCFWNHRGGFDSGGVSYDRFVIEEVLRRAPRFLANSREGARFLQVTFGLPPDAVTILPNAYVQEEAPGAISKADAPAEPGRVGSGTSKALAPQRSSGAGGGEGSAAADIGRPLELLHVANLYPEKDPDTLLRGLKILAGWGVGCRLHMCGAFLSEADREAFSALSRALGVQDRVVDHGSSSRSELARLLSQADIGLLSSRSEGQPNSVMEYMGFGLPVVGTRIPGIRELLGPDGEEWLFDVGDAEGFAGAVRHLAEDAALRAKIGRSNRRRITEVYAPERVLPRWGELLEPLAAPGSEHPAAVPGPGGRFRRS